MVDEAVEGKGPGWRKFVRNHRFAAALFVIGAISACVGAIRVFLWFSGEAQSSGLVPGALASWTMGHVLIFILYLVFWELVLIGIPAAIACVAGWLWWRRLPGEERSLFRSSDGRSRKSKGSNAISTLFFIAFCAKVYIDGNWDTAISSWSFDYIASSIFIILVWGLMIVGIPAAIAGIWWLRKEADRTP